MGRASAQCSRRIRWAEELQRTITGELQHMTTGRGLSAGRLWATCVLSVRADYRQGRKKVMTGAQNPSASWRAPNSPPGADSRPADSPRPVVISDRSDYSRNLRPRQTCEQTSASCPEL